MTANVPTTESSHGGRPLAESIVSNSLTLFGGQIAIKLVSFLFSIVVIRYLGSEEYGKYAICMAFGGLFTVISDMGLATLLVKRIARDRADMPWLVSNILVLRLLLSGGVVALTSVIAWLVGYPLDIRLGIVIASCGLISYSLFGVADAIVMGQERFRFSAVLNVVVQVVTLVLAAVLVFGGLGFFGLLTAATAGVFLVGVVAFRRLRAETSLSAPVQTSSWPGLIRAAWPFAAITLALSLSYRADAVILSMYVGTAVIGTYAVAYNLIFTFATLSHSINLALFPALTRQHREDPSRSPEAFRQSLKYLFFISLPVAVFVSAYATQIVTFLYGEPLAPAGRPLAVLAWVIPLMFLSEFLGYAAIIVDRERLAARANWVSAVSNVGMNLALIPFFGVMAAAATTIVTEAVLVCQYNWELRRNGLFADLGRVYGRTLVAIAALALLVVALRVWEIGLLPAAAVAVPLYLIVSFAVGAVSREEARLLIAMLRGRLGASLGR